MKDKVRQYIEQHDLLHPGDRVIVGLSGGADSVALLLVLHQLGYDCIAAHCNFTLRSAESDRDEAFAQAFAEKQNIPFVHTTFDTHAYAAQHNLSIEMAARDLRYNWFETVRQEHQAQAIAVGHHQDDLAETILLNLIRGTGLQGLTGMASKNGYIVRPLLAISRQEIQSWLADQQQEYVTDSTNLEDQYTRNFIRLRILPLMEELNPSIRQTLAHTSIILKETKAIFDHAIQTIREDVLQNNTIHISKLMTYPGTRTILHELLYPYGFTPATVEQIDEALQAEPGKQFYSADRRFRLVKDRDTLILSETMEETGDVYEIDPSEGDFSCGSLQLTFHLFETNRLFDNNPDNAWFDYDKLQMPLTLRRWQEGNWFIPFGMTGKKKVSDYFSDHKYSLLQKEQSWLLCSGADIIWIVGERSDNRFRVDNNTKKILFVKKISK